ncbi:hypothetical protein BofuT4_P074880.1 [Botrytis cinerea T4]|uniref:Uncharacterized protein n=1 Tax=Botryotinia fuckeliana (strain T4) TaxID=999810 RepID=G2XNE9_BOTF4|nr:hypothetical protein BofuT4_P074880.1 [Botrytis cinerea T4]
MSENCGVIFGLFSVCLMLSRAQTRGHVSARNVTKIIARDSLAYIKERKMSSMSLR